jgi:SPP1 gp7 family putative phage head morphogenesis protein
MSLVNMLQLEVKTLSKLRAAVVEASDRAESPRANVNKLGEELRSQLESIIADARDKAVQIAYDEVVDQAEEFGIEEPDEPEADKETEARAIAAAASILAVWLLAVLNNLTDIPIKLDYKLRIIAATEVAHAYGQATLRTYDGMKPSKQLMKRWDATLDRKTCSICRELDGQTVPINKQFRDGLEPGDVHPSCRCVPTLIYNVTS